MSRRDRARSSHSRRSCRELRDWDCYAIASQNWAQLAKKTKTTHVALALYADALRLLPPGAGPEAFGGHLE